MQFLLQAVPRDPRPLLPFPPGPLRSVEVGCARSPSNSEASSNRSHHNDAAIRLGGRATCGQGEPAGAMLPTQTKPRVNPGVRGCYSPLWASGKCWCFPMRLFVSGSLAWRGLCRPQGKSKGQNKAVASAYLVLFGGSESSLPIPHPEGSPHPCYWVEKHRPRKGWKERVPK